MLSRDDNDLLNHVGPGTAANSYLKHFWMPFMRSEALEAGGMPEKVELLGEKYVAFRDTSGTVGFLDEACPHRGISLSLGRNENNALTCIFHGWSFNAKGECVATPTEPNKVFCKKVKVRSYPVREAGGAIWVYLAPGEPARFPDLPFAANPERGYCRRGISFANWSHTVEQFLDNGHVGFLHRNTTSSPNAPVGIQQQSGLEIVYHLTPTDYGYRTFVRREQPGEKTFVTVYEFLAPLAVVGSGTEEGIDIMAMVTPINDRASMFWTFLWATSDAAAKKLNRTMIGNPNDWIGDLIDRSKPNFGQDRKAMKTGSWSGFTILPLEDIAVAESMPMIDRTKEYLGRVDVALIRFRKDILQHLQAIRDGKWSGRGDLSAINYRGMTGHSLVLATNDDMVAHVETLNAARIAAE